VEDGADQNDFAGKVGKIPKKELPLHVNDEFEFDSSNMEERPKGG